MTLEQLQRFKTGGSDRQILGSAVQIEDDWFLDEGTYGWYFAVGAVVKPIAILELGVRFGYGLIAMAKGAMTARPGRELLLTGIDNEADGIPSNAIARRNIKAEIGETMATTIFNWDTRRLGCNQPVWFNGFSLVHVDADHSVDGITAELSLAFATVNPASGCILVDDCDVPHVCAAAIQECKRIGVEPLELPTFHRTMVIDLGSRRPL